MTWTIQRSTLLLAIAATVGGVSTTSAAQNPQGLMLRSTQGTVLGFGSAGGQTTLRVMTRHANRNRAGAANLAGAAASSSVRAFTISPQTQFQALLGMNRMPATAAALRPGQRVIVQAQGPLAMNVQIVASNGYGRGRRSGMMGGRIHVPNSLGSSLLRPTTQLPSGSLVRATGAHHAHAHHVASAQRK